MYESVGVKTKRQEECAFSITENHLSWGSVGFDHDAGTFVPCSDRVDPRGSQESERRPVTHCQAVSEAAGSDGSCVQRDTYWPAVHETPTVVAQDQGVLPEGKPASHDQGHAALPTCLRHVETTLVLVWCWELRVAAYASDRRIPHRLGSGHEWPPCPRSVKRSSRLAHQQARDVGSVSGSEILSPRPKRSPCVSSHRQHSGGLLYQPPRRSEVASPVQVGAPDPCVSPGQTPLTQSSLHTWASQCGSRHPVETGAFARGMDASHRGGETDLESVWPGPGGPLRYSGGSAMSPLVLSTSSSPTGISSHKRGSSPPPGDVEVLGVAPEGAQLVATRSFRSLNRGCWDRTPIQSSLSEETVRLEVGTFTSWCGGYQLDPVNCPCGTVLEFVQACSSTGLTHSTLKVT